MRFLQRGLGPRLEGLVAEHPVVIVEGARAVGKTTLVRQLLELDTLPGRYVAMEDELQIAKVDPLRWLTSLPFGSVIDEAQLLPELLLSVKRLVDQDPTPGRLLLTGSSRLRADSLGGSDALAGRAVRAQLHPFTAGEMAGRPISLLADLARGSVDGWRSGLNVEEVRDQIDQGGMPGAVGLSETGRIDRFEPYADRAVGAANTGGSRHGITMRLVRHIFAQSPTPENSTELARQLEVSRDTILSHVDLLEESFLIWRQRGFALGSTGEMKRAQLVALDSGIISAMAGPRRDLDLGSRLETFVLNDLRAQASWEPPDTQPSIHHWRFKNRSEVDLVLAFPSGNLVAIEVKASQSPSPSHTKWLTSFRGRYEQPGRRVHTYVFYMGDRCVPYLDHWFVPIGVLSEGS